MPIYNFGSASATKSYVISKSGSTSDLPLSTQNLDMLLLAENVIADSYTLDYPTAKEKVAKWRNSGFAGTKYDAIQPVQSSAPSYQSNQINGFPALRTNGFDQYMRFAPAGMDLFNALNGVVYFCLYKNTVTSIPITSISGSGSVVTVTLSQAIDPTVIFQGNRIGIIGNSISGYNSNLVSGPFKATTSANGTTITYADTATGSGTGGTAYFDAAVGGLLGVNTSAYSATQNNNYRYYIASAPGIPTGGFGNIQAQLRRSDADTLVSHTPSPHVAYLPVGSWNLLMHTLDYTTNTTNAKTYNLNGGTGSGISNTSITTPRTTSSFFTGGATVTDSTNSAIQRTPTTYLDAYGSGGVTIFRSGGVYLDAAFKSFFGGQCAMMGVMRLTGANTITSKTTVIQQVAAELKARYAL